MNQAHKQVRFFFRERMEWEGVTIPGKVMAEQAAQAWTHATEDFFNGHLNT